MYPIRQQDMSALAYKLLRFHQQMQQTAEQEIRAVAVAKAKLLAKVTLLAVSLILHAEAVCRAANLCIMVIRTVFSQVNRDILILQKGKFQLAYAASVCTLAGIFHQKLIPEFAREPVLALPQNQVLNPLLLPFVQPAIEPMRQQPDFAPINPAPIPILRPIQAPLAIARLPGLQQPQPIAAPVQPIVMAQAADLNQNAAPLVPLVAAAPAIAVQQPQPAALLPPQILAQPIVVAQAPAPNLNAAPLVQQPAENVLIAPIQPAGIEQGQNVALVPFAAAVPVQEQPADNNPIEQAVQVPIEVVMQAAPAEIIPQPIAIANPEQEPIVENQVVPPDHVQEPELVVQQPIAERQQILEPEEQDHGFVLAEYEQEPVVGIQVAESAHVQETELAVQQPIAEGQQILEPEEQDHGFVLAEHEQEPVVGIQVAEPDHVQEPELVVQQPIAEGQQNLEPAEQNLNQEPEVIAQQLENGAIPNPLPAQNLADVLPEQDQQIIGQYMRVLQEEMEDSLAEPAPTEEAIHQRPAEHLALNQPQQVIEETEEQTSVAQIGHRLETLPINGANEDDHSIPRNENQAVDPQRKTEEMNSPRIEDEYDFALDHEDVEQVIIPLHPAQLSAPIPQERFEKVAQVQTRSPQGPSSTANPPAEPEMEFVQLDRGSLRGYNDFEMVESFNEIRNSRPVSPSSRTSQQSQIQSPQMNNLVISNFDQVGLQEALASQGQLSRQATPRLAASPQVSNPIDETEENQLSDFQPLAVSQPNSSTQQESFPIKPIGSPRQQSNPLSPVHVTPPLSPNQIAESNLNLMRPLSAILHKDINLSPQSKTPSPRSLNNRAGDLSSVPLDEDPDSPKPTFTLAESPNLSGDSSFNSPLLTPLTPRNHPQSLPYEPALSTIKSDTASGASNSQIPGPATVPTSVFLKTVTLPDSPGLSDIESNSGSAPVTPPQKGRSARKAHVFQRQGQPGPVITSQQNGDMIRVDQDDDWNFEEVESKATHGQSTPASTPVSIVPIRKGSFDPFRSEKPKKFQFQEGLLTQEGDDHEVRDDRIGELEVGVCHVKNRKELPLGLHMAASFEITIQKTTYPVQLLALFESSEKQIRQKLIEKLKESFSNIKLSPSNIAPIPKPTTSNPLSFITSFWNRTASTPDQSQHTPSEKLLIPQGEVSKGIIAAIQKTIPVQTAAAIVVIFEGYLWSINTGQSRILYQIGDEGQQLSTEIVPSNNRDVQHEISVNSVEFPNFSTKDRFIVIGNHDLFLGASGLQIINAIREDKRNNPRYYARDIAGSAIQGVKESTSMSLMVARIKKKNWE